MPNSATLLNIINFIPINRLSLFKGLNSNPEIEIQQEVIINGTGLFLTIKTTFSNGENHLYINLEKLRSLRSFLSIVIDLNSEFFELFNIKFDLVKIDLVQLKNRTNSSKIDFINSTTNNIEIELKNNEYSTINIRGVYRFFSISFGSITTINIEKKSSINNLKMLRISRLGHSMINCKSILVEQAKIENLENWSIHLSNSRINNLNIINSELTEVFLRDFLFNGVCQISGSKIKELVLEGFKNNDNTSSRLQIKRNQINKIYLNSINFKIGENLLNLNSKTKFDYRENTVESFITKDVSWSYHSLYTANPTSNTILSSIIELKSSFAKMNDIHTERVFEAYEKQWHYRNNKKNFPLIISWYSNEFGMSLLKPIIWILVFVVIEIMFILMFSGNCSYVYKENWGSFIQLINPAHKTSFFLDLVDENSCILKKTFINSFYILDNTVRILIGYLLFQFISAFRYKYNLK